MNGETLQRVSVIRSTANMQGPPHTVGSAAYAPTHKLPLVTFGDAMFGKENAMRFSGHRHGPIRCALEDFENGESAKAN